MTLKEWQEKLGNIEIPGMHGIYDTYDMDGRIVGRDVYVKGRRVLRIVSILSDKEMTIDEGLL